MEHPIDAAVRAKLRELAPNQPALAATIGRSQGWVNKYMNGDGHATIDDVIRIAAALIGVNVQPLTEVERRLLKAWRRVPDGRREDALVVLETVAKRYQLQQSPESNEPEAHTPRATGRKERGKR